MNLIDIFNKKTHCNNEDNYEYDLMNYVANMNVTSCLCVVETEHD